jgi:hypothetical protein
MIGEDDELQAGARGGGGDAVRRSRAVRPPGMDVDGAAHGRPQAARDRRRLWRSRRQRHVPRRRRDDEEKDETLHQRRLTSI